MPLVLLETNMGEIRMELYPESAPVTVENFLAYVREGHYDGLIFHRVIGDFMIQGGGFTEDMRPRGSKRPPIRNEADNGLKNERGAVAMARTAVVDSATDQFFINTVNNDFLNYRGKTPHDFGYAVFGKVIDGMDVVGKISRVHTVKTKGYDDVPKEPVTIVKASVIEE
ncbi:MAG: peptidylprolyl isomerase [Thermodesulfobacteriota bacterium]